MGKRTLVRLCCTDCGRKAKMRATLAEIRGHGWRYSGIPEPALVTQCPRCHKLTRYFLSQMINPPPLRQAIAEKWRPYSSQPEPVWRFQ